MFEHAILMDATFMRKRVPPDNRLVVLHRKRGCGRHQFRCPVEQCCLDPTIIGQHVAPRLDRHDDFLECGITSALADAVDRAFDLTGTAFKPSQRVCHRQPQVIVAMHREDRLVGIDHTFAHGSKERAIFVGCRVAHGIWDIDRGRTSLDRGIDTLAQEIYFRARAILGRPFDV